MNDKLTDKEDASIETMLKAFRSSDKLYFLREVLLGLADECSGEDAAPDPDTRHLLNLLAGVLGKAADRLPSD